MSFGEQPAAGGAFFRRRGVVAAAVGLVAAAVALAVVLASQGRSGRAANVIPAKCDSYGPGWVKSFNKTAKVQGNPTRMISACCAPAKVKGVSVHHCFIKLTLAGTKVMGCATYDLGMNGLPVSPAVSVGQHQNCPLPKQT